MTACIILEGEGKGSFNKFHWGITHTSKIHAYNSIAFSVLTVLCKHHHYLILGHLCHPRKKLHTISSHPSPLAFIFNSTTSAKGVLLWLSIKVSSMIRQQTLRDFKREAFVYRDFLVISEIRPCTRTRYSLLCPKGCITWQINYKTGKVGFSVPSSFYKSFILSQAFLFTFGCPEQSHNPPGAQQGSIQIYLPSLKYSMFQNDRTIPTLHPCH